MKTKLLLHLFLVILTSQALFSCSSGKQYTFSGSTGAYHQEQAKVPSNYVSAEDQSPRANEFAPAEKEYTNDDYSLVAGDADLSANSGPSVPAINANSRAYLQTPKTESVVSPVEITEAKKKALNNTELSKKESRLLQKLQKKQDKQQNIKSDVPLIALVILAIILPPLAVFLHSGIGTPFWISLLLTLLFWIPGVIYALLVVTDTI